MRLGTTMEMVGVRDYEERVLRVVINDETVELRRIE